MTKLIVNGILKLVEPDETIQTALLIEDDRIAAIGDPAVICTGCQETIEIIDAHGAVVLPGFIDAHNHFTLMGIQNSEMDLSGLKSKESILERVRQWNFELDPAKPLIGTNYEFDFIQNNCRLNAFDLQSAAPGRQIQISDRSGHLSVTTEATLTEAGISLRTEGCKNCVFPCGLNHDDFNGEICGVVNSQLSKYMRLAFRDEQTLKTAWKQAAETALSHGVTSVHAIIDEEEFLRLHEYQDRLPLRLKIYAETKNVKAVKAAGIRQIGGCGKVMIDGDTGPYTAAFLDPYTDRAWTRGLLYYSDEELEDYIWQAHSAGLQTALHCVGDGASEQLLTVLENVQQRSPRKLRHRIEHFEFGTADQILRARKAGIMISMQPAFNYFWPHETYITQLGLERALRSDPVGDVIRAGIPVGFGSDCPVTPCDPMLTLSSAVNHSLESQRITASQAIRAHTYGGAYIGNDEKELGSLSVGKAADLVFLEADPTRVNADEIKDIQVLKTMVRGEVVYQQD